MGGKKFRRISCARIPCKKQAGTGLLCGGSHSYKKHVSWQCRKNGRDGVLNHQPHDCFLNRLYRHRSKKTSKPHITGLCAGNSPGPVNSPHKWPVTQKMYLFDDVIMFYLALICDWFVFRVSRLFWVNCLKITAKDVMPKTCFDKWLNHIFSIWMLIHILFLLCWLQGIFQ